MCNRYQLRASAQQIRTTFGLTSERFEIATPAEYFPGSIVPVIRAANGGRELAGVEWGIPLGKHRVTNSRDDKVDRTWGRFMSRRVVFPLSRAVEWRYPLDMFGQPTGKPKPWVLFPADESVAAIAGIAAADDAGVSMMTCTAAGIAADVHNKKPDDPRMVVFLTEPDEVARWLDPDLGAGDVVDLLKPPPDGWLAGEALA
jgi:putative SOS response-associated peptidase YedK